MKNNKILILKCLVGSRAHGLHTEESDYDYRGVFVTPTKELLSLGYKYESSSWIEGSEDQTTYEIGHFLHLALKCNPSILEVFKAPIVYEGYNTSLGYYIKLQELFPYVWNPQDAFNAFVGYGLNQRKKMLDNHLDRQNKYGVAYIRTLINLYDLLTIQDFSLEVDEENKQMLIDIRNGKWSMGEIINQASVLTEECQKVLSSCNHKSNPDKVNDVLLEIRKDFWE